MMLKKQQKAGVNLPEDRVWSLFFQVQQFATLWCLTHAAADVSWALLPAQEPHLTS